MNAARPLRLLLAALVAVFVLGVALAVGGLLALRDPSAMVVFAVAALAGVIAATITYFVARSATVLPDDVPAVVEALPELPAPRTMRTVASLPVASLPAPYLAAVMKGLHANRQALTRRGQSAGNQAGA
ncbi:hypothetical protein [Ramlibacter pallidus]|uniref:Uncharacterized protein n=1 Tax=Ramlibacter pallidus TaxID=2780087 RepID=A0ABR9SAI4_9BURK|nr:hypothetical protein [Ramlibacter pallidus]MBE7370054.1 hypothetical protein [Ramlibacter pallidus]